MHKCFYLFPLLIFSIAAFGFSSDGLIHRNQFSGVSPTATPTPAQPEESDEIVLDKKVVCHPCPPGNRCRVDPSCPADNTMTINVSAVKPENNQISYKYTVSGGRVIGDGAKIVWDMSGGAQPGTYQIRVDIEDKSTRQNRTEIETITVLEHVEYHCVYCPTLSVETSALPTKAGETIIFTAKIDGGSASEIIYNWKVSAGEIVEGQGTPVIKVATNSKMAGRTVKATVEIEGVCDVCPKSESADAFIAGTKAGEKKN